MICIGKTKCTSEKGLFGRPYKFFQGLSDSFLCPVDPKARLGHHSLVSGRDPAVMAIDVGEMFICSKLKIVAKSFGNGSQEICKCYESNSGRVAGFEG